MSAMPAGVRRGLKAAPALGSQGSRAFSKRAFDAMMGVRMNQLFGERFQAAPGGDDLGEDFRAVAIFVQHPFHRVELTDDLADADNGSTAALTKKLFAIPSKEFQGRRCLLFLFPKLMHAKL